MTLTPIQTAWIVLTVQATMVILAIKALEEKDIMYGMGCPSGFHGWIK